MGALTLDPCVWTNRVEQAEIAEGRIRWNYFALSDSSRFTLISGKASTGFIWSQSDAFAKDQEWQ